jgi:hypothetical protein
MALLTFLHFVRIISKWYLTGSLGGGPANCLLNKKKNYGFQGISESVGVKIILFSS